MARRSPNPQSDAFDLPAPPARVACVPTGRHRMKQYDKAYFDRWYRHPRHRVHAPADVQRKVHCAVALAEYLLARPITSVLDIGCGEGAWEPLLRELRPRLHYQGIDPSEYAVRRFGRRRNIRLGAFADVAALGLERDYDLVVCADVLHYVPTRDLRVGLAGLRPHVGGVAWLEAFARGDEVTGDLHGWHHRSPALYRRLFREAGLEQVGPHAYLPVELLDSLVALERAARFG